MRSELAEELLATRNPIRGTFPGCWACATVPHIANAITRAMIPTNFRFWILDFRLSEQEFGSRSEAFSLMCFSSIQNPKSQIPNYLITRSARANTFGGIVKPICLAALRLIKNSYLLGRSTGRSVGFVPLMILST
jgi:hypothetical protein